MSAAALPATAGPRAIARASWWGLRNQKYAWLWAVLAALAVAAPIVAWFTLSDLYAGIVLGAVTSSVLVGGYMALIQSLLRQNQPQLARLLPGQVRALRQSALLIWLVAAALSAAGSLWRYGTPLAVSLPLLLAMLVVAWAMRHPLIWAFIWVPLPVLGALGRTPLLNQAWQTLQAHPWMTWLVAVVVGGALLCRVFGDGDEAHQKRFRRQQTWRASARAQKPVGLIWPAGSFFDRLQRLARWGYIESLLRQSARASGGPVSTSRALLVLGPQAHWATLLAQLALMLGIFALIVPLIEIFGLHPHDAKHGLGSYTGLTFGTVAYVMGLVQSMRVAVYNTRHEQALLSLAPGMPRGRALNHAIATRLMLQFLLLWGLVGCGEYLLLGDTLPAYRQLLSAALGSLPVGLWLWSDWSRAKAMHGGQVALLYVLPALLSILLLSLLVSGWIDMLPLTLLELALLVPLAWWRWRRALNAPSAFPAGRLG
jgi:hypothetical protein